jgi:glycerol-3-phosphate cytidylyltransferase
MIKKIFKLKQQGVSIGFTASTFDVLHPGHIIMLAEAKARCDFLIVGLLTDPTIDRDYKNKPAQTTLERWVQVAAVEFVDMIIPFDTERDLEDMLNIIQPNIRIVGEEYRDVEFTGKHIDGIEIYYNPRSHSFSTSELRERIVNAGNVKPTQTRSTAPKE